MCELVGAPELSEKQFADGAERAAVAQTLAARFRQRTSEDWESLFTKEQLPITLVKSVSEVVTDPHVRSRELLPLIDVPDVGKLQVIAHPAKHAEMKVLNPARVPGKGQSTVEIMRSLGYTPRQIQALAGKGVIGT
jgi:crotonobetainyl-CoA:carnitine CoA-transferase CaiB-like acyl-CoA transferase